MRMCVTQTRVTQIILKYVMFRGKNRKNIIKEEKQLNARKFIFLIFVFYYINIE